MRSSAVIDLDRLMGRLFRMAEIGATPAGGVNRLALTDEDKAARALFTEWCADLSLSMHVDPLGNQFARKEGKNPDAPALLVGSHLDSQPLGGKYDGALGVLAGLEIVHCLIEDGIDHMHPVEIVNWTNEEGARFAPATTGSGYYSGEFSLDFARGLTDRIGIRFGEELDRIGYNGSAPHHKKIKACLELHIEQGPVLEAEAIPVGVVTGVQGIRWYEVDIEGSEIHAGPTPMEMRKDPVRILHPFLNRLYTIAEEHSPDTRITVGSIITQPGSINTVPGTVSFTIDFRHPDGGVIESVNETLHRYCDEMNRGNGPQIHLNETWYSPPVRFHKLCMDAIEQAAGRLSIPARRIISGAGHDSMYLSRVAPTGMVFIPCRNGISHNESEYADPEDIEAGVSVLYEAVKSLI
jgi:beta-ureidopropionase / N-carbamoyl-L-amino-acid hydrolase